MTERLLIRPARERDCEFIGGLVPSLLEFGSPTWDDAGAFAPGLRDVLADAVRAQGPQSTVLVAEGADATRLGFISLRVGQDVVGAARGHVADLAVTADARRRGVGTALMRAGEAWARDRGLPALSLDVWSTNERALAFYRRLGYRAESLCLVKSSFDPERLSTAKQHSMRP
jgi:ribosomal protein S18 acetylase RimI-like enzyme